LNHKTQGTQRKGADIDHMELILITWNWYRWNWYRSHTSNFASLSYL